MEVKAIRTRKFLPPKDNLWKLLEDNIKALEEKTVVAISSKVVSIGEGRCVPIASGFDKEELVIQETDKYLPKEVVPHGFVMHTIKNNVFIASAGIDESNGGGFYILWPKHPYESAKTIWEFLRKKFKVRQLGVILTDSRLVPLRRGVVGIAIGYFGFKPIKDYRGKEDIFGREFKVETSNLPDSLATAAILEMGEGKEQQPIALITNVSNLEFVSKISKKDLGESSFEVSPEEDLFYPFLSSVPWRKGGGGV